MEIPHFRGIYMRNAMPCSGPWKYESAVVNLDDQSGPGTHWVAYKKKNHEIIYFDSFGNLRPPQELINYFGDGSVVKYNHKNYQNYDTVICGHLCLKFLADNIV